jgi:hypothetical protein
MSSGKWRCVALVWTHFWEIYRLPLRRNETSSLPSSQRGCTSRRTAKRARRQWSLFLHRSSDGYDGLDRLSQAISTETELISLMAQLRMGSVTWVTVTWTINLFTSGLSVEFRMSGCYIKAFARVTGVNSPERICLPLCLYSHRFPYVFMTSFLHHFRGNIAPRRWLDHARWSSHSSVCTTSYRH